jgi:hypothetical protein
MVTTQSFYPALDLFLFMHGSIPGSLAGECVIINLIGFMGIKN